MAVNRVGFSAAQPFLTHEIDLSRWKLDAAFHRLAGMAEILLFLPHASKQFSRGFGPQEAYLNAASTHNLPWEEIQNGGDGHKLS